MVLNSKFSKNATNETVPQDTQELQRSYDNNEETPTGEETENQGKSCRETLPSRQNRQNLYLYFISVSVIMFGHYLLQG